MSIVAAHKRSTQDHKVHACDRLENVRLVTSSNGLLRRRLMLVDVMVLAY